MTSRPFFIFENVFESAANGKTIIFPKQIYVINGGPKLYLALRLVKIFFSQLAFSDDDVASFLEELGAFLEGHLANLDVVSIDQ